MKSLSAAGLIAMLVATALLASYLHGHAWFDSGHGLPEGQMIHLGFVPYRDFFLHVTPLSYLITAATFSLGKPLTITLITQTVLISLTPVTLVWCAYKNKLAISDTALAWGVALFLSAGMLDGLFHHNTYTVYAEWITFLLLMLMGAFYTSQNAGYYRAAALCWGLLLVSHQYYAFYTSPLIFWILLAAKNEQLRLKEKTYALALAVGPALLLTAWLLYSAALKPMINDLMVAAYDNINKDINPSIGEWFRSIYEPLIFLLSGDYRNLVKSRGLITLWLWVICLYILFQLMNHRLRKAIPPLRRHMLTAWALALLLSFMLVSRHYGGNRILTLLSPQFVFAVLAIALVSRADHSSVQRAALRFAFYGMVVSAAAVAYASRSNLLVFFDAARWAPYRASSGETLLIDPSNAAKFTEAIHAINAHRTCLTLDKHRGVDRMIILGRGNQLYYAVNAIPYLPYIYLEDTLLGEQRFTAVLSELKRLYPRCLAMFTFERYNSPWEKHFRGDLTAWLNESYSIKYSGDGVYIYSALGASTTQ